MNKTLLRVAVAILVIVCIALLAACAATDAASEPTPPTGHPTLIAHAGGAVYGYRYTNSQEALDSAYANGFRYFELDMNLTADGEIVLLHDWETMVTRMVNREGRLNKADFLGADAFADVTLMDLDRLAAWLKDHGDAIIITDIKDDDNVDVLTRIVAAYPEYTGNFIPQIYQRDQYDAVKALGFERIIYTLYRADADPVALGEFVAAEDLWAVTIPAEILNAELLDAVHAASTTTAVYCNTVNDLSFYEWWRPYGLSGIYTDYFIPDKWPYPLTTEEAAAELR